jgi:6-phosphogluconolactonase/glucosamine-6-phosphate isomerase/deaminase
MGDDGHTASLFPSSPALREASRWIAVNAGPSVTPPDRVTMTYPLLNAARYVAVLVTGEKKARTIARVDEQFREKGPDPERLPITGVDPTDGDLMWYLDAAAAGAAP